MEQTCLPKQNYSVLVNCMTYNQSVYIEDALNGFAIQKTKFPFVCLVMDDSSIDGEQDVIKEWFKSHCDMEKAEFVELGLANVVHVNHKENVNCHFVCYLLKRNLWKEQDLKNTLIEPWRDKCKYEALCEGDDYWIDSNKLQKQVDFLESHPDYSMCFHSAWNQYGTNPELTDLFSKVEDRDYSSLDILSNWIVPTASVLFRKEVIDDSFYKDKVLKAGFMFGDTPLFLSCARMGKVRGISDVMSVYRRHEKGESNNKENTIHVKLETYYEKLGQVFGLEKIGNSIVATLKFDAFLESVKKRHIEWHTLADLLFHTPFLFAKCVCNRLVTLFNKK